MTRSLEKLKLKIFKFIDPLTTNPYNGYMEEKPETPQETSQQTETTPPPEISPSKLPKSKKLRIAGYALLVITFSVFTSILAFKIQCTKQSTQTTPIPTPVPIEQLDPKCLLKPVPGSCKALTPGFYFDQQEGICKQFIWGGCRGVRPFTTLEDCKSTCERPLTNWKTYTNTNHRFSLTFPYPYSISTNKPVIDNTSNFWTCFDILEKEVLFCIKVNLNSEITPPFLTDTSGCPICKTETKTTFLSKEIKKTTYSAQKGLAKTQCPSVCTKTSENYISNEHSVEFETCIANDQSLYDYIAGGETEATLLCKNNDPLYRFSLICKGSQWVGKNGQSQCSSLFDQILSTFKFLD
jgi:hypothetical protein